LGEADADAQIFYDEASEAYENLTNSGSAFKVADLPGPRADLIQDAHATEDMMSFTVSGAAV
jgi:hypothetical protein